MLYLSQLHSTERLSGLVKITQQLNGRGRIAPRETISRLPLCYTGPCTLLWDSFSLELWRVSQKW